MTHRYHTGPFAHPAPKPARHSRGSTVAIWVAVIVLAFGVAVLRATDVSGLPSAPAGPEWASCNPYTHPRC